MVISLERAAAALQPRPLDLEVVADRLRNTQSNTILHQLAKHYLPTAQAAEIINARTSLKATIKFARYFDELVFPLMLEYIGVDPWSEETDTDENDATWLTMRLMNGIPYRPHGIEYSYELHELHDSGQPALIAIGFAANIFNLVHDTPENYWDMNYHREKVDALRAVWADHLTTRTRVPEETLNRVPTYGHPPSLFAPALAGTTHARAADVVTYLAQSHNNIFLGWYDTDTEINFTDPWTVQNVDEAIVLWEEARTILRNVNTYCDEQTDNIPQMMIEILEHLESYQGDIHQ